MHVPVPDAFPPARQLWQGVVLATIANAIWQARDDSYLSGRSWNGTHYWVYNEQRAYGVIGFMDPLAFEDQRLVALLCDQRSERAQWEGDTPPDWRPLLTNMPTDLREWAERDLLDYMRQVEASDSVGTFLPLITAAFWSEGDRLRAAEPWASVLKHGCRPLKAEVLGSAGAIQVLDEDYGFSDGDEDELVALLRGLFERKMADPRSTVVVQPEEQEILESYGNAGIATSRELLAAIGIILP